MGFITYKQYDSRWGNKNYNGSSTMSQGGCGPTACAMIIYGIDGKTTPLDTMKYMQTHGDSTHKKFALYGQGTAWNGITQCLKNGGLKDVQVVTSMSKAFDLMSKGYVGVLRFQAGTRGNVTWTTAGHYIAVTGYKEKNGKHYLYTRDSGGRNHTGWYCYETTMKGLLDDPAIWLGRIGDAPKKVSYKHCIDTSYWQGKHSVSDWKEVRKSCTYAIHRASYTSQSSFTLSVDSTFKTNFKNAQKAGFRCGAYHYSQAKTVDEAKREAEFLCRQLNGLNVDFYVVCDYEFGGRLNSKTAGKANEVVNAFCDVVKSHGYSPCIYANTSTLNKYITKPKYPIWVAQYNTTCDYKGSKVMWQYTSSGRVAGISGKVDLSLVYATPKTEPAPAPKIEPKPSGRAYSGEFPNLVAHSCDKIAVTADNLSYALKTSKSTYTFPNGKPKDIFKTAINKVYPKRSSWSKQCQAGASCDVGAGTIIRYSGVDTKMPRGLQEQIPYLKKHWTLVGHEKNDMKRGYVGVYSGNGGHIWIGLGNGIIAEANHTAKYFEHKVQKTIGKGNHTYFAIFKPSTSSPIGKGDKGTQVKKLQLFLKWYGADCGTVDGECGDKTVSSIKNFQYHEGLTVDGVCGKKTLEKMKGIKR